ncbi:MAG: hypothetical protein JO324_06300 [Candidatus Eremiobacteraeota bacterium]|nr:hypothetical protein [Candidatus Eremiobacteraeota bacterium]
MTRAQDSFQAALTVGWALVEARYEVADAIRRFMLLLLFERDTDAQWRLVYDQGTSIA